VSSLDERDEVQREAALTAILPLLSAALLVGGWQFLVTAAQVPEVILPSEETGRHLPLNHLAIPWWGSRKVLIGFRYFIRYLNGPAQATGAGPFFRTYYQVIYKSSGYRNP